MINYENLGKVNEQFKNDFVIEFSNIVNAGTFILGENVERFEVEFANYLGVEHVVGVANGLEALELSFICANLPRNSEIIVAANSYYACILSILNAGLKPVLVEPDASLNLNPKEIEKCITDKTKGILAVHMYGNTCDMDSLLNICKKHNLLLFEDCAQSHGASFKNKKTGSFGDFAAFSFYPTKNLGALGDGGAVVCKTEYHKNTLKMLRHYGFEKKYYVKYLGRNSRLDEIQASFLRVKLKKLDEMNKKKKHFAQIYFDELRNLNEIKMAIKYEYSDSVYHIFPILTKRRDELKDYLEKNNIKTEIHYPIPPHLQIPLLGVFKNMPITESISNQILSLPISFSHTEEDIKLVCKSIKDFFN